MLYQPSRDTKDRAILAGVILAALVIGRYEDASTRATGPQDVLGWSPQESVGDQEGSNCAEDETLCDEEGAVAFP